MGRHVNTEAEIDEHPDVTRERLRLGTPAQGHLAQGHPAQPYPAPGRPLEAQAVISPDTHIGSVFEVAPGTPDAAASPAHPDALIRRGLVGDGHELE